MRERNKGFMTSSKQNVDHRNSNAIRIKMIP